MLPRLWRRSEQPVNLSKAACTPDRGGQRRNFPFKEGRYACVFYMFLFSNSIVFIMHFFVRIAVLPLSVDYLQFYAAENKKTFVGLLGLQRAP